MPELKSMSARPPQTIEASTHPQWPSAAFLRALSKHRRTCRSADHFLAAFCSSLGRQETRPSASAAMCFRPCDCLRCAFASFLLAANDSSQPSNGQAQVCAGSDTRMGSSYPAWAPFRSGFVAVSTVDAAAAWVAAASSLLGADCLSTGCSLPPSSWARSFPWAFAEGNEAVGAGADVAGARVPVARASSRLDVACLFAGCSPSSSSSRARFFPCAFAEGNGAIGGGPDAATSTGGICRPGARVANWFVEPEATGSTSFARVSSRCGAASGRTSATRANKVSSDKVGVGDGAGTADDSLGTNSPQYSSLRFFWPSSSSRYSAAGAESLDTHNGHTYGKNDGMLTE
ncbi:hypothetical protein B0H21DRAFT_726638 [Amylocystis lapponica]|nr:hypothetical protein B0H21DRAFT_726638 [Amylocystis lapponica]